MEGKQELVYFAVLSIHPCFRSYTTTTSYMLDVLCQPTRYSHISSSSLQVKKVSYLQGEVGSLVGAVASSPLPWLPVGGSLNLRLSYHDNRGRTFHATNAQPASRASRWVGWRRGQGRKGSLRLRGVTAYISWN